MSLIIHPSIVIILLALLLWVAPRALLHRFSIVASFVIVAIVYSLPEGTIWQIPFINQLELTVLQVDIQRWMFAMVLVSMFAVIHIYGNGKQRRGEIVAGYFYGAGAIGCIFAGDWLTLLFFWELMAISSTVIIWYGRTENSVKAGIRYLIFHFFGGNLLLVGILLKIFQGAPEIQALTGSGDLAHWLIFLGIAVNAAIPPLHTWLTDAYPETSISGILYMNIFTTKVAVFMLILVFPGLQFLIWIGIGMALYGVLYAMLENDMRRLLSYHIVSQVGLMLIGIGIGTEVAINGAMALAIGNILFKSLLFMSCGVVIHATGRGILTELGGLYRTMPWNTGFFLLGALAIAGFPLLIGFISKGILSVAANEYHTIVAIAIYTASVGTFLSIPLKLGYFGFIYRRTQEIQVHTNLTHVSNKGLGNTETSESETTRKNSIGKEENASVGSMYLAMSLVAVACISFGVFPRVFQEMLPYSINLALYSWSKVIDEILFMGAILAVFFVLLPRLNAKETITLDVDWFYRNLLTRMVIWLSKYLNRLGCTLETYYFTLKGYLIAPFARYTPDKQRAMLDWILFPSLIVFVISIVLTIAVH